MYECKLPFNPSKKFSNFYPNFNVLYLSKWDLDKEKDGIIYLRDSNNILISLPKNKFEIHFREV